MGDGGVISHSQHRDMFVCAVSVSTCGFFSELDRLDLVVDQLCCRDRGPNNHQLDTVLAGTDLPQEQMDQLHELLHKHNGAFCLEDGERGETNLVELHINTGETAPLRQRVRRMPFALRKEVANQLHKMQLTGVLQPSSSPWASPVVPSASRRLMSQLLTTLNPPDGRSFVSVYIDDVVIYSETMADNLPSPTGTRAPSRC